MKAILYAMTMGKGWEVRWTVAWEVDAVYWSPAREDSTAIAIRTKASLPLGIAESAAAWLTERLRAKAAGAAEVEEAACEMKRAIGLAWEAACGAAADEEAQREIRAAQEWPIETERLGRRGRRGGAAGEAWVAAGDLEAGKLEAMAKAARQAGECLRGRSLLREEAAALLAESSLREEPEALRALQLAALLGAARLRAAVQPAAAGSARRSRALRCRRCGSGEERMRRTRCASCGRSGCAVCEACATLGRSRECGLLALGAAPREQLFLAPPPASAAQQDAAPDAVLDRRGLSPAQRSASADAVRFLREKAFTAEPARLPETRPVERHNVPSHPGQHFLSPLRKLFTLRAGQPFAFDRSFLLWAVTGAGKTEMVLPTK